jgi:hypothetical protein
MGIVVAFFFIYYLNNGIYQSIASVFLIAFIWEIVEHNLGIRETFNNRTMDIILPLIAVIGVYNLHRIFEFSQKVLFWSLSVSASIFLVMSILGWVSYAHYK